VYAVVALVAYLLGSIPTGFLVGKAKGIDIRQVGSGNIGATNVFRYLGKGPGVLVMLVDALKGWLAVRVAAPLIFEILAPSFGEGARDVGMILSAICAVMGHNYTCWLNFKGGKGIATSAGVLVALVPYALLIILAVWVIVVAVTRYVSLASMLASFTLPFASWATGESVTRIIVTGAMAALAIYKHKPNIQRLLNGTEHKITFGKGPATSGPEI
jgi:glycerol-3-phosphate acyltransferase PlsY